MRNWQRDMFRVTKKNAGCCGIPFKLKYRDFEDLLWLSQNRCMLSGIPFDFTPVKGKRRPFAPSIDRIDSAEGYTRANCRLVCCAVNIAMNEWGYDVLLQISHALVSQAGLPGFHAAARPLEREVTRGLVSLKGYLDENGIVVDPFTQGRLTMALNRHCREMRLETARDSDHNCTRYRRDVLDTELKDLLRVPPHRALQMSYHVTNGT